MGECSHNNVSSRITHPLSGEGNFDDTTRDSHNENSKYIGKGVEIHKHVRCKPGCWKFRENSFLVIPTYLRKRVDYSRRTIRWATVHCCHMSGGINDDANLVSSKTPTELEIISHAKYRDDRMHCYRVRIFMNWRKSILLSEYGRAPGVPRSWGPFQKMLRENAQVVNNQRSNQRSKKSHSKPSGVLSSISLKSNDGRILSTVEITKCVFLAKFYSHGCIDTGLFVCKQLCLNRGWFWWNRKCTD